MPLQIDAGKEIVPGYRLVRMLGEGGFGQVWEAEAPGRVRVALKFIRLDTAHSDPEVRALDIIREIRHPHLLEVQFATQVEDRLIIAMSLCDKSLWDRLKECRAQGLPGVPTEELLEYMQDAARALDYLNEARHPGPGGTKVAVSHRDIKPHNMFLFGESVKLADFGLVKILEKSVVSHTGSMTPAYAPPEMFAKQVSPQSDQWSLAVSYYQLHTGELPFAGSIHEIVYGIMNREPDLRLLSPEERAVVGRALSKDPHQRWPSCRQFASELASAACAHASVKAVPAPFPDPVPIHGSPAESSPAKPLELKAGEGEKTTGHDYDTMEPESVSRGTPSQAPVEPPEAAHARAAAPREASKGSPASPRFARDLSKRGWRWGKLGSAVGGSLIATAALFFYVRPNEEPRPETLLETRTEMLLETEPAVISVGLDPPESKLEVSGQRSAKIDGVGSERLIHVSGFDGAAKLWIAASAEGYESLTQEVSVTPGQSKQISIRLNPFSANYEVDIFPADANLAYEGGEHRITGEGSRRQLEITRPQRGSTGKFIARLEGYVDSERWIQPAPGESTRIAMRLNPKPAVHRIEVNPPEATLEVESGFAEVSGSGKNRRVEVAEPDSKTTVSLLATSAGYKSSRLNWTPRPGDQQQSTLILERVPVNAPNLLVAPFSETEAKTAQEGWSRYLNKPVIEENSIGMKLVLIPAGEFEMGSPAIEEGRFDNEGPVHRVRITKPFCLGQTEVTQGQWKAVMGTEPWKGKDHVKDGAGYPVTNVSWEDAVEYCKRLSAKEGKAYRLPTEAEWEYACRAGSQRTYYFGDSEEELGQYAWYYKNAWDVGEKYAHLVGQKKANGWGLYDMHGNVWEWCSDWNGQKYYGDSPRDGPPGPMVDSLRVSRGGSWNFGPVYARSAYRFRNSPGSHSYNLGFRVASSSVK